MLMKTSSPNPRRKAISRAAARNAALANQLATPGLGSLMAGRWLSGIGQIILAVAGCAMVLVWFFKVMIQYYGQISSDAPTHSVDWKMPVTGAIVFAASWFWSLVTSLSLLYEAEKNEVHASKNPPPPLN
jgi:hypothetical protein